MNSKVDAYIAKAPAFAQPILAETRKRVHAAVPDVEEVIKWNVPFFLRDGKFVASMAAFKAHTKIGVWTGMKPKMVDVTTVKELPPAKTFIAAVKKAAAQGSAAPAARRKSK